MAREYHGLRSTGVGHAGGVYAIQRRLQSERPLGGTGPRGQRGPDGQDGGGRAPYPAERRALRRRRERDCFDFCVRHCEDRYGGHAGRAAAHESRPPRRLGQVSVNSDDRRVQTAYILAVREHYTYYMLRVFKRFILFFISHVFGIHVINLLPLGAIRSNIDIVRSLS